VLWLAASAAFEDFVEAMTGEDIPDTVQTATKFCIAVAGLLLFRWSEREDDVE
jgi:hypothetical protein